MLTAGSAEDKAKQGSQLVRPPAHVGLRDGGHFHLPAGQGLITIDSDLQAGSVLVAACFRRGPPSCHLAGRQKEAEVLQAGSIDGGFIYAMQGPRPVQVSCSGRVVRCKSDSALLRIMRHQMDQPLQLARSCSS